MAHNTFDDFNKEQGKVVSPSMLAHVVLRTANFQAMEDFYLKFLGGRISYRNEHMSFITYDEEHHRIAVVAVPGTGPKQPKSSGLEHIAFTFPNLHNLLLAYRQRQRHGIEPVWAVNHGPTISIYYKDPDRNMLETQVDNFDTAEDANAFMSSPQFAENPIGTDVNVEELIERLKQGEGEASLKKRVEKGPRGLPDVDAM